MFVALGFAFLEINPLTIDGDSIVPLDAKARLDDAASFECAAQWGELTWPAQFGRAASAAERRVEQLDARTGASLKLDILNPAGTVWTMVAGGGASVIYTDTIADLGFAGQLANYGEYSGNPSTADTYAYACEVLGLMTESKAPAGQTKYLLIGGGIANFTDVAETFAGIIQARSAIGRRLIEEADAKLVITWGDARRNGDFNLLDDPLAGLPLLGRVGICFNLTPTVPHGIFQLDKKLIICWRRAVNPPVEPQGEIGTSLCRFGNLITKQCNCLIKVSIH